MPHNGKSPPSYHWQDLSWSINFLPVWLDMYIMGEIDRLGSQKGLQLYDLHDIVWIIVNFCLCVHVLQCLSVWYFTFPHFFILWLGSSALQVQPIHMATHTQLLVHSCQSRNLMQLNLALKTFFCMDSILVARLDSTRPGQLSDIFLPTGPRGTWVQLECFMIDIWIVDLGKKEFAILKAPQYM